MLGVLATGSACSPFSSKTASPARTATPAKSPVAGDRLDPAVPTPAAFPPDVPVYTGARLTSGAAFTSPGQLAFGMEWQTLDSVDKVLAFYKTKFSQGDWQITIKASTTQPFSATYSRKSNPKVNGMLGADGSSGITRITLSLVVPT